MACPLTAGGFAMLFDGVKLLFANGWLTLVGCRAVVLHSPYLLGRIGVLMLGSKVLVVPGTIFLAVGLILMAGATGAVRRPS
jgi:hypothetical protein